MVEEFQGRHRAGAEGAWCTESFLLLLFFVWLVKKRM